MYTCIHFKCDTANTNEVTSSSSTSCRQHTTNKQRRLGVGSFGLIAFGLVSCEFIWFRSFGVGSFGLIVVGLVSCELVRSRFLWCGSVRLVSSEVVRVLVGRVWFGLGVLDVVSSGSVLFIPFGCTSLGFVWSGCISFVGVV